MSSGIKIVPRRAGLTILVGSDVSSSVRNDESNRMEALRGAVARLLLRWSTGLVVLSAITEVRLPHCEACRLTVEGRGLLGGAVAAISPSHRPPSRSSSSSCIVKETEGFALAIGGLLGLTFLKDALNSVV